MQQLQIPKSQYSTRIATKTGLVQGMSGDDLGSLPSPDHTEPAGAPESSSASRPHGRAGKMPGMWNWLPIIAFGDLPERPLPRGFFWGFLWLAVIVAVIVGAILTMIWSLVSLAVSAIRKSKVPHNRDEDAQTECHPKIEGASGNLGNHRLFGAILLGGTIVVPGCTASGAASLCQEPARHQAKQESVPTSPIWFLCSQPDAKPIPIPVDQESQTKCF